MLLYIDKVHYEADYFGNEYIEELMATFSLNSNGNIRYKKSELISLINTHNYTVRTKYLKYGYWFDGEDVRVIDNRYLRTDSNYIKADNLGELPRY